MAHGRMSETRRIEPPQIASVTIWKTKRVKVLLNLTPKILKGIKKIFNKLLKEKD